MCVCVICTCLYHIHMWVSYAHGLMGVARAHVCMWHSTNMWLAYAHVSGYTHRGQGSTLGILFYDFVLFKIGSLTKPGPRWKPVSTSHFCSPLQHWGSRNTPPAFYVSAEIQTQILMPVQQALLSPRTSLQTTGALLLPSCWHHSFYFSTLKFPT